MVPSKRAQTVLALTAAFTLLYSLTATRVFSYDGLIDAVAVEYGALSPLFHPNHLLYPSIAALIYHAVSWGGKGLRAITVMQAANAATAGLAVGMFFAILEKRFGWRRALLGTVGLGVCQAFWVEAVDPGSYAWATLAACLLLGALVQDERLSAFRLGLIHGFAVVAHQLLILVVPAVLIRRGWRGSKAYFAGLAITGGATYLLIAVIFHGRSVSEAIHWMFSPPGLPPGGNIQFLYWWNFDVVGNAVASWKGFVQSFMVFPGMDVVVFGGVAWLVYRSVGYFKNHPFLRDPLAALWVWIILMNVFLFFYVPGALRFRLLFLPAFIYMVLALIPEKASSRIYSFCALGIFLMGFCNYTRVTAPQAKTANSPNLTRALWVAHQLRSDDVFLFSGVPPASITNVYVLYFAPQVRGRSFQGYFFNQPGGDLRELQYMVEDARFNHRNVFVEGSLFDPAMQNSLEEAGHVPKGMLQKWLSSLGLRRDWVGMDEAYGIYRIS